MILLNIITIGCSISCFMALYCFCKSSYKKIERDIKELKHTPKVEKLQVFVPKPMHYFSSNESLSAFNKYSKEKVAECFTQKLTEDKLIKMNDLGDFIEATLTIVKE